jgi:GNAT superfamily N-acetyltransferase
LSIDPFTSKGYNRYYQEGTSPIIMDYRLAAVEDIPALAEMRWERDPSQSTSINKAEFMQVCQRFLEEAFASERWYIWVAAEGDELISHIYVQFIEKVPRLASFHPCFGYVTNVFTRPAWRGQGVGGKLMETVISWTREEGLEMLVVWPSQESIEFYQRSGFTNQTEMMELHLHDYQA